MKFQDKTKFWTWRTTAVAAFVGEADTTLHKASTTYITLNPKQSIMNLFQ